MGLTSFFGVRPSASARAPRLQPTSDRAVVTLALRHGSAGDGNVTPGHARWLACTEGAFVRVLRRPVVVVWDVQNVPKTEATKKRAKGNSHMIIGRRTATHRLVIARRSYGPEYHDDFTAIGTYLPQEATTTTRVSNNTPLPPRSLRGAPAAHPAVRRAWPRPPLPQPSPCTVADVAKHGHGRG